MSTKRADLTFILVRPRYPGNIGSAARALKNMGFTKLVLVRPSVLPSHPESQRMAVGAADLLKKAKVFETIQEATRGLHYLVGTTRRTGKYRDDFVSLPELKVHLPLKQKVGILFGSEEKGLTNRELAYCHLVTTIPSNPDYPSLNLAQAVIVVAYQLKLFSHNSPSPPLTLRGGREALPVEISLATTEHIEGMYQHLEKMLTQINFFPHKNSFHMMRTLRQLFGRTGLTEREVRILRGVCRQILWAVDSQRQRRVEGATRAPMIEKKKDS